MNRDCEMTVEEVEELKASIIIAPGEEVFTDEFGVPYFYECRSCNRLFNNPNDHYYSLCPDCEAGKTFFNEHGVCLNPEKIIIADEKQVFICIEVAKKGELWVSGHSYRCGTHGNGSPCCGDGFKTRELAISDSVDWIHGLLLKEEKIPVTKYLHALDDLTPRQLDLFGVAV